MGKRTLGWWLLRLNLATAIGAILVAAYWARSNAAPCVGCDGIPVEMLVLLGVAALLLMVSGLAWMIRIFRGSRDEPPPWRYRDD